MATTPSPLVWDFYREVGASGVVGGVIHYYDEAAQNLYNSGGLQTQLTQAPEGHWEEAVWGRAQQIVPTEYTDMDLDHPYNGVVFGSAVDNTGQLVFLRYVYAMDCTYLIASGSLSFNNSSPVVQLKANILNTDEAIFMNEATLFQPGAKADLKIVVGDEKPYDMAVTFLDSVDYNITSKSVPISGRNSMGFKLMEATFDDLTIIAGLPHEVVAKIMEHAEVTSYLVEPGTSSRKHFFDPDQTLLSGLEQVCEVYSELGWKIAELPNGTILVGSPAFIESHQSNGYYVFQWESLFKRKTKRSSDAAYSKVRVTGVDADDNDLNPVTIDILNYAHWKIPAHKTYHAKAPDGLTQEELGIYAIYMAMTMQYVGIGEDFTGPIQPQLLLGDVAAIDNGDGTMTNLGLITSIKHSFGQSGFSTDFSTDSGGILNGAKSSLTTITKSLSGYNRNQNLKDLIQVVSSSKSK